VSAPAVPDPAARGDARRSGALTIAASAGALLGNLVTGVIVARAIGPNGRGELVAILTLSYMAAWALAFGAPTVAAYFQARFPQDAARLVGTWVCIVVPAGIAAVLVAELLLPVLFTAQSHSAVTTARVSVLVALILVVGQFFFSFLLGAHRFGLYNLLRVGAPLAVGLAYLVLWALDELTVRTALIAFAAVNGAAVAGVAIYVVRAYGIARPSAALARETVAYGLRAQLTTLGEQINGRLDLLLLPAFLGASAVGLYSVATNVSWIIASGAGALHLIALPKAARDADSAPATIVGAAGATIAIATAGAVLLAVAAEPALRLVYGDAFGSAASALRLLLPGCVLYAGAGVFAAGLAALGRPLSAAAAQGAGLVITVVGLLVLLPGSGIETAAAVSSVAYSAVFVTALLVYRRAAGLPWRAFVRLGSPTRP
jgi:O-antigen/teichoic acid export membrane protein